ncbi:hypothetical protein ACWDR0_17715 [Streptomyces sp. NPDC003691]
MINQQQEKPAASGPTGNETGGVFTREDSTRLRPGTVSEHPLVQGPIDDEAPHQADAW